MMDKIDSLKETLALTSEKQIWGAESIDKYLTNN